MEKDNVLIITRRFINHTGLGTELESFHELTSEYELFKIIRNSLKVNDRLKSILNKKLGNNDENVAKYKEYNKVELDEISKLLQQGGSTQSIENISISDAFAQKTNINTFRFLLGKQDSQNITANSFSKQTETNIEANKYFYILNIVNPIENVFVFAHWASELDIDKQKFIEALRDDVVNILVRKEQESENKMIDKKTIDKKTIENKYCFNWLVHDSDILQSDYDGCIQYDKTIFYHPDHPAKNHIPTNLKEDNIWCFIHNTDTSDNYKNLIIDYKTTFDDKIKNQNLKANDFVDALLIDGCARRMKLLGIEEITESTTNEQLYFIFQKPFAKETFELYKNLIKLEKSKIINGNGN